LPRISPPTEDGFVDDPRIPESLEFFYSRSYNLLQLTMWSIALCVMSYITVGLALTGMLADEIGIALVLGFLVLLCLYCSVENIFQLRDTRPQLVLSSKGLKIKRQFFNKKHIKDVTVARTPKGGRVISVSIHNVWLGWTEDIRDLDVDHDKLEDIVEVFKGRWRAETENELAPTKTGQV
jgi:hypothetical protein